MESLIGSVLIALAILILAWKRGGGAFWLPVALASAGLIVAITLVPSATEMWEKAWLVGIRHGATPTLTTFFKMVTAVGSPGGAIAIALAASAVWWRQGQRASIFLMAVTLSGAGIIEFGMKHLTQRPRPMVVPHLVPLGGFSFPSGHATAAIASFGMLAFLIGRQSNFKWPQLLYAAAGLMILLIGFSRIYLGVHWPTDVLGGFLFGGAWLAFLVRWEQRRIAERKVKSGS